MKNSGGLMLRRATYGILEYLGGGDSATFEPNARAHSRLGSTCAMAREVSVRRQQLQTVSL